MLVSLYLLYSLACDWFSKTFKLHPMKWTTLNTMFSITYCSDYTLLYLFTIDVMLYQVKMFMFYNVQTTFLTIVDKTWDIRKIDITLRKSQIGSDTTYNIWCGILQLCGGMHQAPIRKHWGSRCRVAESQSTGSLCNPLVRKFLNTPSQKTQSRDAVH